MLKTPRQVDEHGEVTLDPRLPESVQQSDEAQERWLACANVAMAIVRKPLDSPEVANFATVLYDMPIPTHRDPDVELMEARDPDFERLHPRGRDARFVAKHGGGKRKRTPRNLQRRARDEVKPVGKYTLAEIKAAGLDGEPAPSAAALRLMGGHRNSASLYYAQRDHAPDESLEHPPYKRERRARHNKIVGRFLAGLPDTDDPDAKPRGVAALFGVDDPLVVKLAGGGRLSEAEVAEVRQAAHDARSGEAPDALFMAGGPASGKTTTLAENPELEPGASVLINADVIKTYLPEFQELWAKKDMYAATAVHRESGDIAARLADEAEKLGLNVVVDGTGDSEPADFIRQLQRKNDAGYDVSLLYANTPTDTAIPRSLARAETEGRFVPIPAIKEQHAKVSRNFEKVVQLPWLQHLDVFDDKGLIGTKTDGVFHATEPARMESFIAKKREWKGV